MEHRLRHVTPTHPRRQRTARAGARAIPATLLATLLAASAAGAAAPAQAPVSARAAGVQSLHERASLRIVKNTGSSIEARGTVSGTLSGSLLLHVTVRSAEQIGASLTGSSSAGSLSGSGTAGYAVSGSGLFYHGTVSITHGTGRYAHDSGSGIRIEGVMSRAQKTISVTISGQLRT